MAYKRKRVQGTPRYKKKTGYKKRAMSGSARRSAAARTIQGAIRRALNKNIETKRSIQTSTDGSEIWHNNFITLDSTVLQSTPGVYDPMNNAINNRIGDKINLVGVKLRGMIEMNERYTDVTFRLLVVKAAKGDTPTRATLFNGISGNKMLDTINTERYTIIASKYMHLKPGGLGTVGSQYVPVVGQTSGVYLDGGGQAAISRVTKIWKLWIPGKKFTKSGVVTYEDNSSQVKFFDYHVLLYAYSNYSTLQDVFYVARNNDYVKEMFFKDA